MSCPTFTDGRESWIAPSMICGGMLVEAGELLGNKLFLKRRIALLGLPVAVERQVEDVECMLAKLMPDDARMQSREYFIPIVRQVYRSLVKILKKRDDADREVSTALLDIGVSFSEWSCYEDAIDCWMTSLLTSSVTTTERSEVFFRVAGAFEQIGDNSEAIQAYTQALSIFTENNSSKAAQFRTGDIHEMLGRAYYNQQNFVGSLEHSMKALQLKKQQYGKKSPALASIYHQIGASVLGMGKEGDAKDAFGRSLKLVESDDAAKDLLNPDFLIAKGLLGGLRGRRKVTDECFDRALEILKWKDDKQTLWKISFVNSFSELFQRR